MNKLKKIFKIIICSLLLFPMLYSIDTKAYDNNTEGQLKTYLLNKGVSEDKITKLILKLANNEEIDALKTYAIPEEITKVNINNSIIETKVFKDGSVIETKAIYLGISSFYRRGISCGTGACWGDYHFEKYTSGVATLSCWASIEYSSQYGKISSVWQPSCYPGTLIAGPSLNHYGDSSVISMSGSNNGRYCSANFRVGPGGISIE